MVQLLTGPAQQDFEWGGSSVSQIFGGGRGGACYPGKIRVLVTLRYRKVELTIINLTMVLTYRDLQEIIAIYLRWPSSWHYLDLDLLQHADESQKERNG